MRERFDAIQVMRPVDAGTAKALGLDTDATLYTAESALYPGHGCARVDDYWYEVDFAPGWRVAMRLAPYRGQAVVAEVRVFPADEFAGQDAGQWAAEYLGVRAWERQRGPARAGITARLLRRVPLGAQIKHAHKVIEKAAWTDLKAHGLHSRRAPKRQRSDRRPDSFYARLAADYAARLAAGSRRPVAEVAERRKLEASVVRDAIHAARERGFLTGGAPGRQGGTMTPAARAILRKGKR